MNGRCPCNLIEPHGRPYVFCTKCRANVVWPASLSVEEKSRIAGEVRADLLAGAKLVNGQFGLRRGVFLPAVPIGEPGLVMEPQSLEALLNRLDARCAHVCPVPLSASRKFAAVQRNRCNVRAPSALRRATRGPSRQNCMNNHVVAMPTRSPHATSRANSSGSTLPPDSTTTAVFPVGPACRQGARRARRRRPAPPPA